ncbi:uncharacterized protein [Vulpes vulpes]|uniref:Translation initiation factor IF-2-like n=1 Tax=Vulpes vulpes TaxID=9627 RepID=A0ABM4YLS8_VULVU
MLAVRAARFAPPMHEGARRARALVQLRRRGSRPQPTLQVPFRRRWVGGGCPCGCRGPSRWSRAVSSRAAASPPVPAATVPVPRVTAGPRCAGTPAASKAGAALLFPPTGGETEARGGRGEPAEVSPGSRPRSWLRGGPLGAGPGGRGSRDGPAERGRRVRSRGPPRPGMRTRTRPSAPGRGSAAYQMSPLFAEVSWELYQEHSRPQCP